MIPGTGWLVYDALWVLNVRSRFIQLFGTAGVSQATILAGSYLYERICRTMDNSDQVRINQLGCYLIRERSTLRA